MFKNFEKLLFESNMLEPPTGLLEKIINRIQKEKRIIIFKRRLVFFSVGLVITMVVLVLSSQSLYAGFAKTGFFEQLSLIFSDTEIMIAYWRIYLFSLLEILPVTGLVAFLFAFFVFLELLRFLFQDIKNIFITRQLINE